MNQLFMPVVDVRAAVDARFLHRISAQHRFQLGDFVVNRRQLGALSCDRVLIPFCIRVFRRAHRLFIRLRRFGRRRHESGNGRISMQVAHIIVGPYSLRCWRSCPGTRDLLGCGRRCWIGGMRGRRHWRITLLLRRRGSAIKEGQQERSKPKGAKSSESHGTSVMIGTVSDESALNAVMDYQLLRDLTPRDGKSYCAPYVILPVASSFCAMVRACLGGPSRWYWLASMYWCSSKVNKNFRAVKSDRKSPSL